MTGKDAPEDVEGSYMSSNAFQFFGVPMALGRGLLPSDAVDGADPQPVVVLSYKFWRRHFAGDPAIVGGTIQMVRKPYTVIGVAGPRSPGMTPTCMYRSKRPQMSCTTTTWKFG